MRDMVCNAPYPASLAVSCASAACSDTVLAPSLVAAEADFVARSSAVVVVTAIPTSSKTVSKNSLGQKVSTAVQTRASERAATRVCLAPENCDDAELQGIGSGFGSRQSAQDIWGRRRLQSTVASAISSCSTCSKSAARARLHVEISSRFGG
jgi:hypothetical protein